METKQLITNLLNLENFSSKKALTSLIVYCKGDQIATGYVRAMSEIIPPREFENMTRDKVKNYILNTYFDDKKILKYVKSKQLYGELKRYFEQDKVDNVILEIDNFLKYLSNYDQIKQQQPQEVLQYLKQQVEEARRNLKEFDVSQPYQDKQNDIIQRVEQAQQNLDEFNQTHPPEQRKKPLTPMEEMAQRWQKNGDQTEKAREELDKEFNQAKRDLMKFNIYNIKKAREELVQKLKEATQNFERNERIQKGQKQQDSTLPNTILPAMIYYLLSLRDCVGKYRDMR